MRKKPFSSALPLRLEPLESRQMLDHALVMAAPGIGPWIVDPREQKHFVERSEQISSTASLNIVSELSSLEPEIRSIAVVLPLTQVPLFLTISINRTSVVTMSVEDELTEYRAIHVESPAIVAAKSLVKTSESAVVGLGTSGTYGGGIAPHSPAETSARLVAKDESLLPSVKTHVALVLVPTTALEIAPAIVATMNIGTSEYRLPQFCSLASESPPPTTQQDAPRIDAGTPSTLRANVVAPIDASDESIATGIARPEVTDIFIDGVLHGLPDVVQVIQGLAQVDLTEGTNSPLLMWLGMAMWLAGAGLAYDIGRRPPARPIQLYGRPARILEDAT